MMFEFKFRMQSFGGLSGGAFRMPGSSMRGGGSHNLINRPTSAITLASFPS